MLSIWVRLKFCQSVNPFPNKLWFLRVCGRSLLKTLWEKEKLLVMSNFSFSHSVFYPFGNFVPFSSNLKLSSAKSFGFEKSKICYLPGFFFFRVRGKTPDARQKGKNSRQRGIFGKIFCECCFTSFYICVTHIIPYYTTSSRDILCSCTK